MAESRQLVEKKILERVRKHPLTPSIRAPGAGGPRVRQQLFHTRQLKARIATKRPPKG